MALYHYKGGGGVVNGVVSVGQTEGWVGGGRDLYNRICKNKDWQEKFNKLSGPELGNTRTFYSFIELYMCRYFV